MKTIAIANHEGRCAKTTTALNVAVTLANTGSRALAVDLDPQGNLSASLGVDLQELEETRHTSHQLMLDERGDFSSYLVGVRPQLSDIFIKRSFFCLLRARRRISVASPRPDLMTDTLQ